MDYKAGIFRSTQHSVGLYQLSELQGESSTDISASKVRTMITAWKDPTYTVNLNKLRLN